MASTRVERAVDGRLDELTDLTRRLVRTPSTVGLEGSAQTIIASALSAIGFSVEQLDVSALVTPDLDATTGIPSLPSTDRPCIAARIRGRGTAPSIHLSGHIDVVPVDAPERWTRDPWGGEVADGRVWGRGAGDMKGGLAAYLIAVEAFLEAWGAPEGDIVFSSVIEEECGGNGMKAVLAAGYDADATLIGEPSGLRLQHAGVGVVWARLTATSDGAHPAFNDAGLAPADALLSVISGLRALEDDLNARPTSPVFREAFARPYRLNVGQLSGGVWPSSVPAEMTARVRLGFGPELTPADAQALIASAVAASAPGVEVSFEGFRAPAYCDDLDHDLARVLTEQHTAIHGTAPSRRVLAGTTDARSVSGPCVCYGPIAGNIHGIDEWVDIASLHDVARTVAATLAAWQTADHSTTTRS